MIRNTRLHVLAGIASLTALTAPATGAQQPRASEGVLPQPVRHLDAGSSSAFDLGPEEMRRVLFDYVLALAGALPTANGEPYATSLRVLEMATPEALAEYLSLIPNPQAYVEAKLRLTSQLNTHAQGAVGSSTVASALPPELGFAPDYPEQEGVYGTDIQGFLAGMGLVSFTSDRCFISVWDDLWDTWETERIILFNAQNICLEAGCDPTGIVCIATCGPLAIAEIALQGSELPILRCDILNGNVDAAEIEAAFENTVLLLSDTGALKSDHAGISSAIQNVDSDLASHDANIDGDLAAHDVNVSNAIALHDATIKSDLSAHDVNIDSDLAAHDANIDADLATHDVDVKALLAGAQFSLDNAVELRRVHLQVIELVNENQYLVIATEAGLPVDVQFTAIQFLDNFAVPPLFVDIAGATVQQIDAGTYIVNLNLSPIFLNAVIRITAHHAELVDHFGQVVFHRVPEHNISPGQ